MSTSPGIVSTGPFPVTQDRIDAYARVSGDHNPLHVDPAFAATAPYGRTIAHGQLLIGLIGRALQARWPQAWAATGRMRVKFVAPVFAGDTVDIDLTAVEGEGADSGTGCDITLRVGERVCVVGTADVRKAPQGG